MTGSTVSVTANATDNVGVAGVQFKLDGVNLGVEDMSAPYEITWNSTSVSNGAHALTAVARDPDGNIATSAVVTINVNNTASSEGNGLLGQYFNNVTFSGTPVLTRREAVDFWWAGASPGPGLNADKFSVRWSGQVKATTTGAYQFVTRSDDGVRLWVNGVQIINNWVAHGVTTDTSPVINLVGGQNYDIVMEYYENYNSAVARLLWITPGQTTATVIPMAQLSSP